jgi:hypothetical protein
MRGGTSTETVFFCLEFLPRIWFHYVKTTFRLVVNKLFVLCGKPIAVRREVPLTGLGVFSWPNIC